jgi:hypothetical protein
MIDSVYLVRKNLVNSMLFGYGIRFKNQVIIFDFVNYCYRDVITIMSVNLYFS